MNCHYYSYNERCDCPARNPKNLRSLTATFLPLLLRIIRSSILEWIFSYTCTLSVYTIRGPLSTHTPKLFKCDSARIKSSTSDCCVICTNVWRCKVRYFPGNLPPHPTLLCSGTNFVLTLNSVKHKNRTLVNYKDLYITSSPR